jgi:hypothetical protein
MFNWLPERDTSQRKKVVLSFQARIAKVRELSPADRALVARDIVRLWGVIIKTVGSMEEFAASSHEERKHRVVQMVNFEAERLEEENYFEAWAAELLSYYLAVVAARDDEDEPLLRTALEDLAKQAAPDFRMLPKKKADSASS